MTLTLQRLAGYAARVHKVKGFLGLYNKETRVLAVWPVFAVAFLQEIRVESLRICNAPPMV